MSHVAESAAAQSLVNSLITAIKDQLKYVWCYKTYIKDLNDVLMNLESARERRQEEVGRADRNAEDIYVDVTNWLEDVNKITEEAAKVLEKHENSKKGCCRGVIPNPSTRFLIANEAETKKQEIEKLQQRNNNFQSVSHPKIAAGMVTGSYKGPEYWIAPSRASLLEKISKALLDPNVRIVGIWGASGVGKSVFLKQLEKQVQERKLNYNFDAVTMATVSRSPDWEKVQDDLGYRLGLKLREENTTAQKAVRLRERLSQKATVLIILDDIWENIDLEKLGIPFDNNHPEIKLLLTSRSEQVLTSKMDCEHNFHLKPLERTEAIDLFKQILGHLAQEKATLIGQLANECADLPVLISPLATSLKSMCSWDKALSKLRESNKLGIGKLIDESMKFNYHLIESEEAKLVFLLCGQIGTKIIPIDKLIISGLGLGLLEGVYSMEQAREKVKLLLDNLKASCLLEDYSKGFVKIHDLMGDAALSIASKKHISLVIRDSIMLETCFKDDLRSCKSISICSPIDIIHELPEGLMCPQLDMLLVSVNANNANLKIPDAFFKNMRKLKILLLNGLSLDPLPSSIQFLNELHTLCLEGITTKDLKIIGKLKTLQALLLSGLEISQIPKEIGDLKNLRFLDLGGCKNLKLIEPNVLGSLIHMEELFLPMATIKWDAEGTSNASLNELNNMSHLSTLQIRVPNVALLPNNMRFRQLVRYNIYIGTGWRRADFGEERTLKLKLESSNSELIVKDLLQTTLKMTQDLYLYGWIEFEESITEISNEGFPELKHISVENCPLIPYIIHSNQPDTFPVLESLSLFYLPNLQKICKGDLPLSHLKNLKVIKIEACDKLRNIFSYSLVKDFPNIEEINVSDCEMLQEVITYTGNENDNIDDTGAIAGDKFELLKLERLRKLKLMNLRNISTFCSKGNWETSKDVGISPSIFPDGRQVSLPRLESLTLCELPKLTKISHSQYPMQLHLLKSLELWKCNSLLYALDSYLLLQLRDLDSLTIDSCESMETVFNMQDLDDVCVYILSQPLQINLKLSNLPKLKTIWNKNPNKILELLMLQKLEVSSCNGLRNLFSSSMAIVSHILIASCMAMEEIFVVDENNHQETEDVMVFPSLTHLSISNMENLKSFSHGNRHYEFPSLTLLMISSCPKMKTFVSVKHEKDEIITSDDAAAIAPFFSTKVGLPSLEKLVLHSMKSMESIWENYLFEDSFCKLAFIEIKECASVKTIFHSYLVDRLLNLIKVEAESCDSLEILFECGHYSKLQEVRLVKLKRLRHLVMNHSSQEAALNFPSLRDIFIKECDSLISLFPDATARSLSELANMYISSCHDLKEVVSFGGEKDNMALTGAMSFKKLTSLQLKNLSNLVHFCSGHCKLYFPFLKKMLITGCEKLKVFVLRPNSVGLDEPSQKINSTNNMEVGHSPLFDEKVIFPNLQELQIRGLAVNEIWPKDKPTSFLMDLKVLSIEACHQLSIIVPSLLLPNLHSLESLSVISCNSLEVIFKLEKHSSRRQKIPRVKSATKILNGLRELIVSSCGQMQHIVAKRDDDHMGETHHNNVIFPQLSSLKLFNLPRLSSFCDKNNEIKLPLLEEMEIKDCNAVEVLAADSSQHCKPLLLIEKVEFPRMMSMELSSMQNLTKLWHIGTHSECSSEAFCKLKRLEVTECNKLQTVFPSTMLKAFQNLKHLRVTLCDSLESVFESTGLSRTESNNVNDVVPSTFALRELELEVLPRLKHVWNFEDPRWLYLSFEKLHTIFVGQCHSLRHLLPTSTARCLHQLQSLAIEECTEMEEIVWREESAHIFLEGGKTPLEEIESANFSVGLHPLELEWPSLVDLRLALCPKAKILAPVRRENSNSIPKVQIPWLERMCTDTKTLENQQFLNEINANPTDLGLAYIDNPAWFESTPWPLLLERFPNLQTLQISFSNSKEIFPSYSEKDGVKSEILDIPEFIFFDQCDKLTILPPYLALFHNLTKLEVKECHGLIYLLTSSVARCLVQLTRLLISGCNSLEEIVTDDSCDENGNRPKEDDHHGNLISFPHLRTLRLRDLRRLRSFSSTSYNFSFPSLAHVHMKGVPKMQVFCKGDLTTPYKHRITRGVEALYNKEVIEFWRVAGEIE